MTFARVRESRTAVVEEVDSKAIESATYMIGCYDPAFRASMGKLRVIGDYRVGIESGLADVLGVGEGSTVRYASLRSEVGTAKLVSKPAVSVGKDVANDSDK